MRCISALRLVNRDNILGQGGLGRATGAGAKCRRYPGRLLLQGFPRIRENSKTSNCRLYGMAATKLLLSFFFFENTIFEAN